MTVWPRLAGPDNLAHFSIRIVQGQIVLFLWAKTPYLGILLGQKDAGPESLDQNVAFNHHFCLCLGVNVIKSYIQVFEAYSPLKIQLKRK